MASARAHQSHSFTAYMRTLSLTLLLSLALPLLGGTPARAAQPPAQDQLQRVVAAAASCRSGESFEPFRQLEEWVRLSIGQPALQVQVEAGLIQLLKPEATTEAHNFACKELQMIGSSAALPALAELLGQPQTAGFACLALTGYPPGRADEVLRDALNSAKGQARVQIIDVLGDRRDAASVPLLVAAASGTERAEVEAAIAALGKIGNADARQAIAALRQSAPAALRPAVLEASLRCAENLAARGQVPAAEDLYNSLVAPSEPAPVRRAAFCALLRLEPGQAEQRVLQALDRADGALIPTAIAAVPYLSLKNGSGPLVQELPLLEPQQQALLLQSLARRGDFVSLEAVSRAVDSPVPVVRRAAIAALGQAGDMSAVPVLLRALRELKAPADQQAVEAALVELGGGSATDDLITHELDGSPVALRVPLLDVVARRLGPDANPLLFREAADPNPVVAKAALRALGRTARPGDVTALLSILSESYHSDIFGAVEDAAAQALQRIESPAERSKLVRHALDRAQTTEGRCCLLDLLPGCGDDAALEALKLAAVSTDTHIQEAAVRALAEWPDDRAWKPLAEAYRESPKEPLRNIALRGLMRLANELNAHPTAALVARYRALLDAAKTDAEVKQILGALAGVAHPEALDLAQAQLERTGVKAEAEVAVKKISTALKNQPPKAEHQAHPKAAPKK